MSTTTHDIVSKLWNLCNVLKDDGVTYHQYVTELTYLLFLKMAKETGQEQGIPQEWRWDSLEGLDGIRQLNHYKLLLLELGTSESGSSPLVQEIYGNASSFIKKPVTLNRLVSEIDKLDWYSARQEGLGDLYEGLLQKNAEEKKSGAGQYFTPRPLIDAMVAVMQPRLEDVIQDPAAGTGGFLIAAQHWIREQQDVFELHEAQQKRFYERTFFGMEHVQDTHRLALMNLMLHGLDSRPGQGGIWYGDTLSGDGQSLPPATLILTNPPFGTKKGGGLPSRTDFTFPTSNKQFCFLQHIYRALQPGGRAAVVLPDNVLFEGNVGKQIRQDLMEKCNLHTILRLPTGIFYAQGVKTNVLFFSRGSSTQTVWVYDLRANMPAFGKRTPLMREHFAEFEAAYGPDPLGLAPRTATGPEGRWRCFSREEIAERGESLDLAWLKDDSAAAAADLPEPAELARSAMEESRGCAGGSAVDFAGVGGRERGAGAGVMGERELPVGWGSAELGDLIAADGLFSDGDWVESKDQDPKGRIRLLQLADIGEAKFLDKSSRFVNDQQFERLRCTEVLEGDILVARMPDPLGRACLVPVLTSKLITVVDVAIIRPGTASLLPEWLMHAINSPEIREAIQIQSTGTTRRRISRKKLSQLSFPIPPLNEQRRIAAKLDTILAAVDACRQRLEGVAELLKGFRQAVLEAATTGELTREWREEKGIADEWEQASIGQIANVGTGSTPLRSNPNFYAATGTPWITSASTTEELITDANEFVTPEGQEASRLRIYSEGTLLVAMYGEGKTRGQVSELGIPATINQACAAIYGAKEQYMMPFIKMALKAKYLEMRALAEGGNQPNLNLSQIKEFRIDMPCREEVVEICDRVEALFSLADQLEARLTAARQDVERLKPALLAKAFRGELVAQDPADEPASVLLERIRAARQADAAAGSPSRRGRRKAAANPAPSLFDAALAPPDQLATLLRECGALSEKALLAAAELDPSRFAAQLALEQQAGRIRQTWEDGEELWEALG